MDDSNVGVAGQERAVEVAVHGLEGFLDAVAMEVELHGERFLAVAAEFALGVWCEFHGDDFAAGFAGAREFLEGFLEAFAFSRAIGSGGGFIVVLIVLRRTR